MGHSLGFSWGNAPHINQSGSGRRRLGDADAAAGGGAVPLLLLLEVQRLDRLAGIQRRLVEEIGGDQPDDLELEAVGVLAVEALRGAVVGGTDECARGSESG